MAKKSNEEILSDLLKKQDAIKNRIASLEARKRKEEDRVLTRKKIMIGAYIIEKFKNDPEGFRKLILENGEAFYITKVNGFRTDKVKVKYN